MTELAPDTCSEARAKSRHATQMALAACHVADTASDDLRQRVFGRHAILFAHSGLTWLQRWRNGLARERVTDRAAARSKPVIKKLEREVTKLELVRHYLTAKRQPAAANRVEDISTTLHVWGQVAPANVRKLLESMIIACDTLERVRNQDAEGLHESLALTDTLRSELHDASPTRDPEFVYASGDTAAPLRQGTIWTFQGGELGQRIAEINDVAIHLDTLLRVAPICYGLYGYDRLVRSAIFTELGALMDLSIGPPDNADKRVERPLIELLNPKRSSDAIEYLKEVRDGIAANTLADTRTLRNWLGAHIHDQKPFSYLAEIIDGIDYQGYIGLVEYMLDSLDAIGATTLDLHQLLLVEVKTSQRLDDPRTKSHLSKAPPDMSQFFHVIDSPFVSIAPTTLGTATLAGITSSRQPRSRVPIKLA